MAFRLRTAVTAGLRLTFSRNGAVLVGCNAVAQFVSLMLLAVASSQQLTVSPRVVAAPLPHVPDHPTLPTAATRVTVDRTTLF